GERKDKEQLHVRYEWFDQFRGLIIIFLIISVVTWELSGNFLGLVQPIGPPLLNHGYKYFNGYPPIITIIDIGQQIFMFVMGFGAYLAFSSRREKRGVGKAWIHGVIRVGILYLLAFIDDGLLGGFLSSGSIPWDEVLWYGTFANLAIGTFAAYLATYLIPKSADKRIILSVVIMIFHSLLYASGFFEYKGTAPLPDGPFVFPFNSFNHAAIAIAATCFSQWFKMDPTDPKVGFKKRILPVSTIAIALFYVVDWIQPAEHHDCTSSLALLAIGATGFLIAVFFCFELLNFKVPLLSEMGKNLLILFIFALFFSLLAQELVDRMRDFMLEFPVFPLLVLGILPIAIEAGIAMLLAKWKIKIKI
ncbi:MAG: hypothetical protein ACFE96_11610, partial [Candidatus Hermodarchaeota archaeon]